jgi:protein-L-isoaspartate O-methyltransferase
MFIFAATIFVSAFLLFLVQPIIAKQILPWFGGSAAVWTTCMVFFQMVLLAGYAYADWLINKVNQLKQIWVHGTLIVVSLAFLPIIPSLTLKPVDAENPGGRILWLLAITIGVPYFLLSTTGPLVQAWFAKRFPNGDVYRLYALSNVGSLLALGAYPFVIEPQSTTHEQSIAWSIGYVLFAALIVATAWLAKKHQQATANSVANSSKPQTNSAASVDAKPPTLAEQGLWLLLAACGSGILLAITNHITQNVASVPFMWIVPLVIYLVSFILTFDGRNWYMRSWYLSLICILAPLMLIGLQARISSTGAPEWGLMHFEQAVPLYALGLFVATMFCHGELVQRKPSSGYLTRFYLMVSLGGALGGLFFGLAAPLLFKTYMEFPLLLCILAALAIGLSNKQWQHILAAASLTACLVAIYIHDRRLSEQTIEMSRNFYGTLRVKTNGLDGEKETSWRLMHGVILHGEQYRYEKYRDLPTTYYGQTSGIGRAIEGLRKPNMKVGLVGMGVGTLAVYGKPGDQYRFYELNPEILDVANRRFTYLSKSEAKVTTVLGDARLSIEREAPNQFDVLAVDAFSSDSIPVHLITRQAMQLYKKHLAEGGVVAFHISNRYLDLTPVVQQLANDVGMVALRVVDDPESGSYLYRSDWVLVTGNKAFAETLQKNEIGLPIPVGRAISPWTDDYNNLLQILK